LDKNIVFLSKKNITVPNLFYWWCVQLAVIFEMKGWKGPQNWFEWLVHDSDWIQTRPTGDDPAYGL